MTVTAAKSALRSQILAVRAALPESARRAASARAHGYLRTLPQLMAARALLGYAAFGSELDLDGFLVERMADGVGVFLPYVDGADLGVARVRDLEADLAPGWRGVREPRASGRRPARPDRLHAVVVPGVAFDRRGTRLGYGGGHFDRLLARLSPGTLVVGVGFEAQLVDEVPREVHDRAVDVIVTDTGLHGPGLARPVTDA